MWLLQACSGQIAGPLPLIRYFHHASAYRVQDDIPANFKQMRVFLYNDRLVSALEKVPGSVAPVVEELSVNAIHLAHAESEVSIRGFDEEMIVVVHQAVGMA